MKHQKNSLQNLLDQALSRTTPLPGIVIGTAPNIKSLKGKFFSGVKIGVGDAPWRAPEFGPYDYWVCSNSEYPIPWIQKHKQSLDDSKAIILLAPFTFENYPDELPELFRFVVANCFNERYLWYDQSHFGGILCQPRRPCCEFYERYITEPSIQEFLNRSINSSDEPAFPRGHTVALFGYALAILLRLNPIYLIGIELPEQLKDYKYYKNWKRPAEKFKSKLKRLVQQFFPFLPSRPIDFAGKRQEIVSDFSTLHSLALKLGIKTISLSSTSPLNSIPGIQREDSLN